LYWLCAAAAAAVCSSKKQQSYECAASTMAMGRNFRVYHNLGHTGPGQPYSLIMEQKARGEMLIVENYAISSLSELFKQQSVSATYYEMSCVMSRYENVA
jgi:hypothetical protein